MRRANPNPFTDSDWNRLVVLVAYRLCFPEEPVGRSISFEEPPPRTPRTKGALTYAGLAALAWSLWR